MLNSALKWLRNEFEESNFFVFYFRKVFVAKQVHRMQSVPIRGVPVNASNWRLWTKSFSPGGAWARFSLVYVTALDFTVTSSSLPKTWR